MIGYILLYYFQLIFLVENVYYSTMVYRSIALPNYFLTLIREQFFFEYVFWFLSPYKTYLYIEQIICMRYLTLFNISSCFLFCSQVPILAVSYSYWNRINRFVYYMYYGWYTTNRNQNLSKKVCNFGQNIGKYIVVYNWEVSPKSRVIKWKENLSEYFAYCIRV